MDWQLTSLIEDNSPLYEAGRSTFKRTTRKVYRPRKTAGVPAPRNKKEAAIDAFLKERVQEFDFQFVYSGDRGLSKLAAQDFFNEVKALSMIKASLDKEAGDQSFTAAEVMARWKTLFLAWDKSSQAFMDRLRSLVVEAKKK